MIKISDFKINVLEKTDALPAIFERRLHLPAGTVKSFLILKESIDARKKPDVYKIYSFAIETKLSEEALLSLCKKQGIKAESYIKPENISFPKLGNEKLRPIVVGFGPCGMFAALSLAKMGLKPIVLERGPAMDERVKEVENFWKTGKLNPNANCQFGEGGAGTFSDGKLTTGTKSIYQSFVLEEFVKMGADASIMYKQKPHIGTDVLRKVVVNIRKEIIALGGEFFFNTKLDSIKYYGNDICAVLENGNEIKASAIVLALGHSARDTIRTLYANGVDMQQKQFSMGLRIEHPQELIDKSQYGISATKIGLGPADYKMNVKTSDDRGVYTFCMCPGGVVVNASSHEGCITCNGMSYFKRDSGKANSALLADVKPSDFADDNPLSGIAFQEKYEKLAFKLAKNTYNLPTEKLSQFMKESELKKCLPDFVYSSIKEAIPMFGRKLKGFDSPDAKLYAIESRSSSPVRIVRSDNGFAFSKGKELPGLYPAGEGAGYAGGIMSAACDGVRTAFKIAEYIQNRDK